MNRVNSIIQQFKSVKANRIKLHNYQLVDAHAKPKRIIAPVPTRWSSQLAAIKRLLQLRQWIDLCIDKQEPDTWDAFAALADILTPYQVATDILQSDSATMLDIYRQFRALHRNASSLTKAIEDAQQFPADDDARKSERIRHLPFIPFLDAASTAHRALFTHWYKHVNQNAVISCAVLSFCADDVDRQFDVDAPLAAKAWFIDFAAHYISYHHLNLPANDVSNITSLKETIGDLYMQFLRNLSPFATILDDAAKAKKKFRDSRTSNTRAHHFEFDARDIWENIRLTSGKYLAIAAIALLSLTASEASVERTFSAQSNTHSSRRNRLSDAAVEAEMQIKFNRRALLQCRSKSSTHGAFYELNDDINVDSDDDNYNEHHDMFIDQSVHTHDAGKRILGVEADDTDSENDEDYLPSHSDSSSHTSAQSISSRTLSLAPSQHSYSASIASDEEAAAVAVEVRKPSWEFVDVVDDSIQYETFIDANDIDIKTFVLTHQAKRDIESYIVLNHPKEVLREWIIGLLSYITARRSRALTARTKSIMSTSTSNSFPPSSSQSSAPI